MNAGAAILGIITAFGLKVLVLFLSARLLWRALRARASTPSVPLRALEDAAAGSGGWYLKAGLLLLVAGELTCGVELYILMQPSGPLKVLHSAVSAIAAGAILYAAMLYADRRVLHALDVTTGRCIFQATCGTCTRRAGERCRYHAPTLWAVLLLTAAFVPLLFVQVRTLVANPADHVLPFASLNYWYDTAWVPLVERLVPGSASYRMRFEFPQVMMATEFRWLPILGLVAAAGAVASNLGRHTEALAAALACFAAGVISYCYAEAALFVLIPYPYVSAMGHEVIEVLSLLLLQSLGDRTLATHGT